LTSLKTLSLARNQLSHLDNFCINNQIVYSSYNYIHIIMW